jgi:hypothetical protein
MSKFVDFSPRPNLYREARDAIEKGISVIFSGKAPAWRFSGPKGRRLPFGSRRLKRLPCAPTFGRAAKRLAAGPKVRAFPGNPPIRT